MRSKSLVVASGLTLLVAISSCRSRPEEERRATAEPSTAPPAEAPAAPSPQAKAEPAPKVEPAPKAEPSAAAPAPSPSPPGEQAGVTETTGAETARPSAPPKLPPFEGELEVNVQGRAPESIEYAMKGDKIRIGVRPTGAKKEKGVDAIIDTDDQKATVLLNDRKEFVEVDLAKLAAKAKERIESLDVERTGKTATVAGHECEEWKIKDRDYQVSACVMKGAPYFDLAAVERQAGFTAPAWVHRVVEAGYVPLRVTFTDASGKALGSSQITDTSRKVESSKFEIPTGYTKTDASKLGVPTK